jgi:hypothetical protein
MEYLFAVIEDTYDHKHLLLVEAPNNKVEDILQHSITHPPDYFRYYDKYVRPYDQYYKPYTHGCFLGTTDLKLIIRSRVKTRTFQGTTMIRFREYMKSKRTNGDEQAMENYSMYISKQVDICYKLALRNNISWVDYMLYSLIDFLSYVDDPVFKEMIDDLPVNNEGDTILLTYCNNFRFNTIKNSNFKATINMNIDDYEDSEE